MSKKETAAVTLHFATELESIRALALDRLLVDDKKNLRTSAVSDDEVKQLAESIKHTNWISPVLVRLIGDDEGSGPEFDYELVAGFSRVKAAKLLNAEGFNITVPAQVVTVGKDDVGSFNVLNFVENAVRTPLGSIDAANAISTMLESGMSMADIVARTGKGRSWINATYSFLKLSPEIQKGIQTGAIPFKIARALPGMEEEERAKVLDGMKTGKSASEIIAELTETRRVKKAGKGRRKKKAAATVEASGPVYISAKAAVIEFESMIAKVKEEAGDKKLTVTQEWTVSLYKNVIGFLQAKKGIKALHKNIVEAAG